MDARLHLLIDDVVGFRALADSRQPDPVAVALLAELGGVHGIGVHRLGGHHGVDKADVRRLQETVSTRLDLGLSPAGDLVGVAFDLRPHRVTLVPERRQAGGVGGLDAHLLGDALKKHIGHLRDAEIEVALRVAPALDQVKALHRIAAEVAVLGTGAWLRARGADRRIERNRLADAAALAHRLGLRVALVGSLDLVDVEALAAIPNIDEFHVGHACLARGLLRGIDRAVGDYLGAMERGRRRAG